MSQNVNGSGAFLILTDAAPLAPVVKEPDADRESFKPLPVAAATAAVCAGADAADVDAPAGAAAGALAATWPKASCKRQAIRHTQRLPC